MKRLIITAATLTALIALGEGTFPLSEQLVLAAGEKITGEGAGKTTIDLSLLTAPTGVDKGCVVMDYHSLVGIRPIDEVQDGRRRHSASVAGGAQQIFRNFEGD